MALEFAWPWVFYLLPLPLFVYWLVPAKQKVEPALRLPTYKTVAAMDSHNPNTSSSTRLLLLTLVWVLVTIAAARPQWIGEEVQLPATGRDLLLGVDISGSMETPDMLVNGEQTQRIDVVKSVVGDFVEKRNGDRLGLILFGTNAYLHVPLTFDRNVVDMQLNEAQLGFAGEKTAIGDAIAIAVKKLKERPENQRVVILLTDGANTAGIIDPRQAAELAKTAKVKIHTIGVGADEMYVKSFFFSRKVNPSADLDEETLNYIANQTGGRYFRARDPEELQGIYDLINKLEPVEQDHETFRPTQELHYYPLALAIVLSFLWSLYIVMPSIGRAKAMEANQP